MKAFMTVAVLFLAAVAQAKPVELKCRSVEGSTVLEAMTLTLEMPDDQNGTVAPGDWMSQTVTVKYGAGNDRVRLRAPMTLIDGSNLLRGGFRIGADFGSANMVLAHDYDNEEVVALLQVSTDGPITVETHRCK